MKSLDLDVSFQDIDPRSEKNVSGALDLPKMKASCDFGLDSCQPGRIDRLTPCTVDAT